MGLYDYDGPLRRLDGAMPEHGHHFRPMAGDHYYFKYPWDVTDLYVVPLNDGTWLSNKAGHTTYTKTRFPTREAAFRHEAYVAIRMLRSGALGRREQHKSLTARRHFNPIGRVEQAKRQRWLYSVFRKELGNRRRWRLYAAICTAIILHERAVDRLRYLDYDIRDEARRGMGWPPERGKKLIAKYWDEAESRCAPIRERRSEDLTRAFLRVSHFAQRVERLRGRA